MEAALDSSLSFERSDSPLKLPVLYGVFAHSHWFLLALPSKDLDYSANSIHKRCSATPANPAWFTIYIAAGSIDKLISSAF
ncbi:MAG: hypothetical protein ACK2UV_02895, partial [Candidatus Promineifilaceae bacterium]